MLAADHSFSGGVWMLFLDFLKDDRGDMVERGLILAAIVVAAVTIWNTLGSKLASKLSSVVSAVK
jgi:Flp pilus assembly pilin Flp